MRSRRPLRILLLAAFAVAAIGACVTAESSFRDKAIQRVVFELECPEDELTITVLERNDGLGCAGSQVGVEGCGKKAVYVCTTEQQWVNNTQIEVRR